MPIYEYNCRKCGHGFEYLMLRTSPAAKCPSCGNEDLEQLISLSSVSSESSRQANLDAAHKKSAGVYKEKQREDHKHYHEHFQD